jgi:broad specificity phosphatase PhoE
MAVACRRAGVRRILSSPTARCRQTVEPLAERLGLCVEDSSDLAVDGRVLLTELAGHGGVFADAVACTHGELMRPLLTEARRVGAAVEADPDDDEWLLAKGTGWAVELDAGGVVARLRHLVPNGTTTCTSHDWG